MANQRRGRRVGGDEYARLLEFRDGIRRFVHWSETQARSVGLTPAQHQLLLAIRGHRSADREAGAPTIGDVAAHLLLRHHSAVELVDRACAAGLVDRVADPDDHRIVRLTLTLDGDERLSALSSQHLDELRRLAPQMQSLWEGL